jgi:hypothetical protein
MASWFNSWLPSFFRVLSTPPNDASPSPADSLAGSLAGLSAAASNRSVLPALEAQRNYSEQLKSDSLRSMLAKQQLGMQQQNAQREQTLTNAQVGHLNAETNALTNPVVKPKEEDWSVISGITGPNGELVQQEKNSGQVRTVANMPGLKPAALKQPTEQPLGADRVTQLNSALQSRWGVLHPNAPLPSAYSLQGNATEGDYTRLSAALSGEENAFGQKTQRDISNQNAAQNRQDRLDAAAEKANKPTPDETRRADLAGNLLENFNQIEAIVNKRPDLFGPMAGRLTGLREAIGTSDPDIAALNTLQHQIGMAQISAHGMRSAQGIENAATSILNSFHNSPEALKGAIAAARNSVQTFIDDANKGGGSNSGSAAPKQRPPLSSFEH